MCHSAISILIEALKSKGEITPLEKDILDTCNELSKDPFDMESAKRQVALNDANHSDVFFRIASLPTTVPKSYYDLTEDDVRYNLDNQLAMLVEKERSISNGDK